MQNILIVEDNQLQLNMLVNTITNEYPSWTIKCADNYNDALVQMCEPLRYMVFMCRRALT